MHCDVARFGQTNIHLLPRDRPLSLSRKKSGRESCLSGSFVLGCHHLSRAMKSWIAQRMRVRSSPLNRRYAAFLPSGGLLRIHTRILLIFDRLIAYRARHGTIQVAWIVLTSGEAGYAERLRWLHQLPAVSIDQKVSRQQSPSNCQFIVSLKSLPSC
jgi:hypothetical protein